METQEVAEALRDWARATLPALNAGTAFLAATRGQLPDVQVDVQSKRRVIGPDERFPFTELQQIELTIWEVELQFMVETQDNPTDATAKAEQEQLWGFADSVDAAIIADPQLAGNLQDPALASTFTAWDFASPFVQYDDGTKGRMALLDMAVAELQTDSE